MKRAVGLAAILVACTDPPEPAWRLDRPRVLGATVSATGDPTRSSVSLGEKMKVDIFSASRTAERSAFQSHAIRVCPADPNASVFSCRGPDVAFLDGARTGPDDPQLELTAPSAPGELLVFGVFCTGASASVQAGALVGTCAGSAGQELAIRIDVGGPVNASATLDPASARLDAVTLTEGDPCAGEAPPALRADGKTYDLTVGLAAGAVEAGDDLVLSHLATHGDLDRLYSTPDSTGTFRVSWDAPSSLAQDRERARFHFVLRDGRGGTTFLTRNVCLSKGS